MRIVKTAWRAALLAAILGPALAACGPESYTPGQDGSAPPMSVAQARALVRDTILHYPGRSAAPRIVLWSPASPFKEYDLSHVLVTSSLLAVGATNHETFVIRLAAADPTLRDVGSHPWLSMPWSDPRFPGYEILEIYFQASSSGSSPEPGKRLVDALAVLKQAAQTGIGENTPEDDARFAQAAKAYRGVAPKPLPGEDVRRYVVQATAAIRNKDFYGAAEFYEQATDLAPWWPQGRYDRALVLAAIGEYGDAAREMQRYLALVPNAANARQMQDKIYEWQAQAPTAAPAAAIAAPTAPAPSSLFGGAQHALQSK